jgi:hypothetical protein
LRRTSSVAALYLLLALIVIPVFPHFVSPNELSRWLLAAALVETGSAEVTEYAALLGPRFEDLTIVDGRLYPNKAPGAALVSLPGYLIARPFAGTPDGSNLRFVLTLMRICGATLPLIVLVIVITRIARAHGIDDHRTAQIVTVLLFATPLFAYGLLLFSHALVAATLFMAWALLFVLPLSRRNDALAGASMGVAVLSEYTAIIPVAILLSGLLFTRAWSRIARVITTGLPFAALLAAYHLMAFGNVMSLPYGSEVLPAFRELGGSGVFGIHLPSPRNFVLLLFDPSRGLFLFAPVLLLATGALPAAKAKLGNTAFYTLVLVALGVVLLHAGYPNWHGGWNVGPRYIAPAIPFIALPLLFRRGGWIESFLTGASILSVTLTSLVFPFPPNDFVFPWITLSAPLVANGLVAPNLFHLISRPAAIAAPFAIVAAATVIALRTTRSLSAAIAGVLIMIAAGMVGQQLGEPARMHLQRGYIEEVWFERKGALEAAVPEGTPVPPRLAARAQIESELPPTSWPF